MIEQQLGFSLESFLRGIVGISTVLGVAYLMSYDRKRVDWKLVGGRPAAVRVAALEPGTA